MAIMKIEPNVVDSTADFSFGNVTVSTIQTASGTKIDGILEKNYNIPGAVKTSTGTTRWWAPTNLSVASVICSVSTVPTGSALNLAIKKNGTTIETTSILADTATSSKDVSLSILAGDYITIDITQVGSTVPGADLVVTFLYFRN